MVKIIINNSESQVQGLGESDFKKLREEMTYCVTAQASYFSGGFKSNKRHLMDAKGRFPTGLLYIAEAFMSAGSYLTYDRQDNRCPKMGREGVFLASLPVTPYKEQLEAAEAAKRHSRGIIVAPTGSGKSLIVALIIEKIKVNTLVVVPSLELKRQLTETLSKIFGEDKLGKGKPIWVTNVDSLDVRESTTGYDCVIIDEFHHSAAKTYRQLNKKSWNHIYYRFGLTASPFRSQDGERLLLESILSKVIYKVNYQDCVLAKRIVPLEAYYYEIPKTPCSATTWAQVYSQLIVNNKTRNDLITELMISLNSGKKSQLTLVKEIQHGKILSRDGTFPLVTGQNDERHLVEAYSQGQIGSLVSTTGIMGEGIDSRACEYVIIAGLGKSKPAFMQQVGRCFRNFPGKESGKVILFLDKSHKFTARHFAAQIKYLREEYGVVAIKLEY